MSDLILALSIGANVITAVLAYMAGSRCTSINCWGANCVRQLADEYHEGRDPQGPQSPRPRGPDTRDELV